MDATAIVALARALAAPTTFEHPACLSNSPTYTSHPTGRPCGASIDRPDDRPIGYPSIHASNAPQPTTTRTMVGVTKRRVQAGRRDDYEVMDCLYGPCMCVSVSE